jgi:hypothetical protein
MKKISNKRIHTLASELIAINQVHHFLAALHNEVSDIADVLDDVVWDLDVEGLDDVEAAADEYGTLKNELEAVQEAADNLPRLDMKVFAQLAKVHVPRVRHRAADKNFFDPNVVAKLVPFVKRRGPGRRRQS